MHFEFILHFGIQPLITIDQMHRHVCTSMLLLIMTNFNLIKIIISLCFHEHKNLKLTQFISISKGANFMVLH